jgi:hypothetical protein
MNKEYLGLVKKIFLAVKKQGYKTSMDFIEGWIINLDEDDLVSKPIGELIDWFIDNNIDMLESAE